MINNLINQIIVLFDKIDYLGIFFLMVLESTFIPIPSELVIPPAAYLASQGKMNIFLIIIVGTVGSVAGALINYFLGYALGRPIIYKLANHKYSKIFFINERKVKKSEDLMIKYGNISTFLGRLIPGVRHLISIPAGFARMNLKNFVIYTALGSGIWTTILTMFGYLFGANQELLNKYYREISIYTFVFCIIIITYIVYRKNNK